MEEVDAVVVGAGVVGLAVARELALAGREVIILEAADAIGTSTSSRNSEVIHAGIYYAPGSLKAQACVDGKRRLYAYCEERHVEHRRCGKLIVATNATQLDKLQALQQQAQANGVDDLVWLDAAAARAMEPNLACVAALWSPSTGIVDSHGLMLALLGDAESHGAMLALQSPLLAARPAGDAWELDVGGSTGMQLRARSWVNAAGLDAPKLTQVTEGLESAHRAAAWYCKGNYFACAGKAAFSRLIYPIPEAAGLGVHVTLDLGGQMRFGPDVEWLDIDDASRIHYPVDPARVAGMAEAIRSYWPGLPDDALAPSYAGVRPKISGPGDPAADFRIEGPATHGLPGLVNLLGIESPGLTACLSIGARVRDLLA